MKIVEPRAARARHQLEAFASDHGLVPPPYRGGVNWLFVKLTTSDGIEGWGECNGCAFREKTLSTLVHEIAEHFVIGKHDAMNMERLWANLFSGDATAEVKNWTNWRGSGALSMQAFAAIELACWDIVGKRLVMKQPLQWERGTTSDTSVTAVELYARAVGRGTLKRHSPTKAGVGC